MTPHLRRSTDTPDALFEARQRLIQRYARVLAKARERYEQDYGQITRPAQGQASARVLDSPFGRR